MPNDNPQHSSSQQRPAEGASKVSERVEKTAEQVASSAVERVREVRERTQSGLEQQRSEIAHRIRRVGDAFRWGGERLSEEDPFAQQLLDAVYTRIERVAEYVDQASPATFAEDLQGLARRRPGLFFGGAFLTGLALGRFARSSGHVAAEAHMHGEPDERVQQATYPSYPSASPGPGVGSSGLSGSSSMASSGSAATSGTRSSAAGAWTQSMPAQSMPPQSAHTRPQGTGVPLGSSGSAGTRPPYGVGSTSTGTVGTGSSYGSPSDVNVSGPSYGPGAMRSGEGLGSVQTQPTHSRDADTSSKSDEPSDPARRRPESAKPHATDRGQGSKS